MDALKKTKKQKTKSYLAFRLQEELFAIKVSKILSILNMQKLTAIPESPDYIKGVINLRGKAITIIDSHVKFNLEPIKVSRKTSILLIEISQKNKNKLKIGFMVDNVEEVLQISDKKILPPPGIVDVFQSDYITGVFKKDKNNFIMILDIEKVISLKDIVSSNTVEQNESMPIEKEYIKESLE